MRQGPAMHSNKRGMSAEERLRLARRSRRVDAQRRIRLWPLSGIEMYAV